jgi:WD40 repeat protein
VAQGDRLRLHDLDGRKPRRDFTLPLPAQSLDWAGSTIAVGLESGTLWLLDPSSGKVQQFSIHRGPISFLHLDPDGRNALTWSFDGTSVGLDLRSGLPWMRGNRYRPVRFSADGHAVGLQGMQLAHVAPVAGPDFRRNMPVVGRHDLRFSRDGRWLSSSGEGGFAVYSAQTGRRLLHWEEDRCIGALPLAGGREIVLATPLRIVRWRFAESGGQLALTEPQVLAEAESSRFESPSLDAGEHSALVPTLQDRLLRLPLDGSLGRSEIEGLVVPRSPSLSPDGRWLALGTFHGIGLDVRDLGSTSRPPARILAPGNGNARFSPDGRWLAWAGTSTSKVFETGSWKEVHSFPTERNGSLPGLLAWSPGGRMLAITRQGHEVVLLDTRDWSRIATLRIGFQPAVQTLAFSPDGRKLALVHNADEAEVWDLPRLQGRLQELGVGWNLPECPDETEASPADLRGVLERETSWILPK